MQSAAAKRIMRRSHQHATDQARGVGRVLLSFTSGHAIEASIPNLARLPAKPTSLPVQDADGNFLAIPGYNAPDVQD